MDKSLRNQLRNTVTAARKLLEGAISERLEGQYGIFPSGKVEDSIQLGHLSAEDQDYRQQLIIHLEHIRAGGLKPKDAAEQLIREVAFTHLNRLCAYKLMEARGLIRESVSRGVKSQGFFFYLADHPEDEGLAKAGETEKAYRHFLRWLSSSLSEELGALFAPDDPADRLYPPLRVLDQVLELLNAEELTAIWTEDETIGWVYQYFTPKELREQARKESSAPRNSYELAFRNQFYTPRYVVEFLTDNTLGRTWYEMRQGNTGLVETCRYLVRRPNEVWLKEGEEVQPGGAENTESEKTQEALLKEPVHIPFRALKDPRDLKILDPACGSGHFLLYCFDLLERIYAEAWQDCPQVFTDLRGDLSETEFLRRVPGMILRHNLHGIDIDLRATQIASLALWLRAQKAYQALGLRREERPRITRANIVCAEPMPGEPELLEEFCQNLQPPLIGQLVKAIFKKMELAGEAGSLLKIEQELEEAIQAAKAQMDAQPQAEQLAFWPAASKPKQMAFDLRGIAKSDAEFWQTVEKRVLEALQEYATRAVNGQSYRRKLFAGDAAQGLAFVDVCRRRYDIILMNPPFGNYPGTLEKAFKVNYQEGWIDLYACFIIRACELLIKNGFCGCITSRTFLHLRRLTDFRKNILSNLIAPNIILDLGSGVLDTAAVETCASVLKQKGDSDCIFIDRRDMIDKDKIIRLPWMNCDEKDLVYFHNSNDFIIFPDQVFAYDVPDELRKLFIFNSTLEENNFKAFPGLTTLDNERFIRLHWEVPIGSKRWMGFAKGGSGPKYYQEISLSLDWDNNGAALKQRAKEYGGAASRFIASEDKYFLSGLTYPRVGKTLSLRILPKGCIFAEKGISIFPLNDRETNSSNLLALLAILNSKPVEYMVSITSPGRFWESGSINRIPLPHNWNSHNLHELAYKGYVLSRAAFEADETSRVFISPLIEIKQGEIEELQLEIDNIVTKIYQLHDDIQLGKSSDSQEMELEDNEVDAIYPEIKHFDYLQYALGVVAGRWDIRIGKNPVIARNSTDPFEKLPPLSPGSLLSDTSNYPIRIAWDGILVDDRDHPDDIVTRSHDVLELLFPGRGEAVEQEACQVLGVKTLREYFRKPGAGGFWLDHVKRYSKSRRKAPIYWLLQSSRKNYALWLYYHRLDKDLLFKALTQYVEPKIRLEEEQLKTLRAQRGTFGTGGRQAKELDQELERQADLLVELEDFRDKLRRAADLGLEPDLNDGVVLNIAPLWELVPWNEAKKYWQELLEGKYEWSSIGKQLRVKGMVK